jgi:hypothetical protein
MTKPTKVEINCTTGEQTVIELTDAEIAQRETDQANAEAERAAREAEAKALADLKKSARAKLVAGAKLTEQEAAVLVV